MRNPINRIVIKVFELRQMTRKEWQIANKACVIAVLTVCSIFICVFQAQLRQETLDNTKATLHCNSGQPYPADGRSDRYYRAVSDSSRGTESLAAEQLRDLVLSLTDITEPAVVGLLNAALVQRCSEARRLLAHLWKFEAKYACSSCKDTRPLPKTALDTKIRLDHNATWRGFKLPVISIRPEGRLGNLMGEYATVFALHKIYNVSAVLIPKFSEAIRSHFKGISMSTIEEYVEEEWTEVSTDSHLKNYGYKGQQLAAAGLLGARPFLFTDYPFEFFIFNAFRDSIRQEFTFQDDIRKKAKTRLLGLLLSAKRDTKSALTTVGVHVRLTDYPRHMHGLFSVEDITQSYASYLRRAAYYFLERHTDVVFVVTSDDLTATRDIFQELQLKNTFVTQGLPEEDMCLLSLCDHNIVTFGSYGFWAAYLGRGTTVYPDLNISGLRYPHSRSFYEGARLTDFVPLIFR